MQKCKRIKGVVKERLFMTVEIEYEMFVRREQKCENGEYVLNCSNKKNRENCTVHITLYDLESVKSNILYITEKIYKNKKPLIGSGKYEGGIYCDYKDEETGIEMRDFITVSKIKKEIEKISPVLFL